MRCNWLICWAGLGCCLSLVSSPAEAHRSLSPRQAVAGVTIDGSGTPDIHFKDGRVAKGPREPWQAGVMDPKVAADGVTVGWLVLNPSLTPGQPWRAIPGELIVYRAGRVLRRFRGEQPFSSWAFAADGRQVAWHTGPLHGDLVRHCELRDVVSGKLVSEWDGRGGLRLSEAPEWVKSLDDGSLRDVE